MPEAKSLHGIVGEAALLNTRQALFCMQDGHTKNLHMGNSCFRDVHAIVSQSSFGDRGPFPMEPTNDHEREIARLIDERQLSHGKLDYTAVPAVAAVLKFMMTRSDSEFLIAYLHWRMKNPLAD